MWQWFNRLGLVFVVAATVTCGVATVPRAVAAQATPAASPVDNGGGIAGAAMWLLGQQADDGGFVGFEGTSDPGVTGDAVMALVVARDAGSGAGIDAALERAVGYLAAQGGPYAEVGTGQAAKLALAAVAAGTDPAAVGGVDLLALVDAGFDEESGRYGAGVYDHALAMLALTAAGRAVPPAAVDLLASSRAGESGWAFDGSAEPAAADSNTTAVVIQALVAAGHGQSQLVADGLAFLRTTQADNGAFRFQVTEGFSADTNSTALVVQALFAAGEDPASAAWRNASGALAASQNPSGAFRYADDQVDDNLLATLQAVPALAGRPLPILPAGAELGTPAATPGATPTARIDVLAAR